VVEAAAMMLALILAQLADAATAMLLPPGAEANPIRAAASPAEGFALKVLLIILLLATMEVAPRYRGLMLVAGISAGVIGVISNLWAIR
jgi:hypothetical protein